jgi:NAD(P)-dependent dehydrogenase (short-subunit alcohol dehydrogenase family)
MTDRVLITGGMSGIGAAITARCRANGWAPVVLDRVTGADVVVDLSDPVETQEALAEVLLDGPITRLVNNVGIVCPNEVDKQSIDELDLAVSLNLRCALQCLQAVLPGMKSGKFGRIVNVSSRAALGKELRTAYAATKAGLIGMARVWALELGQDGITANSVGPGPIRTELFDHANPPGSPRTKAIIQNIPVGRLGTPNDVAQAVDFLLDVRSGFITGQTVYVCGGLTVGLSSV